MALVSDMGVIGTGGEILQPKLKNRFRVSFIGFGLDPSSTPMTVQVISVDRPKLSFEEVVLDRYNSRAYIAGKHQFETMNMTIEDDIGGMATRLIQQQLERQQKLIGLNGAARMPAAYAGQVYKFSMALEMLDGDDVVLERWNIQSAYLANVDYGDVDYTSGAETVKITLQIRFDHATQDTVGSYRGALATLNNDDGTSIGERVGRSILDRAIGNLTS